MKFLRTITLFVVATGMTALAQKPALVKDTDANGRVPYLHTVETADGKLCSLSSPAHCTFTVSFPAVPAGYRLVLTHVSAQYLSTLYAPYNMSAVLTNGRATTDQDYAAMNLSTPICASNTVGFQNVCVSSGQVSFYLEPGTSPTVTVVNGSSTLDTSPNNVRITLVGYLISMS